MTSNLRRTAACGCRRIALVVALLAALPLAGAAAVTPRDVEVALRTLSFVADPPEGRTELAIIHAPDDPASVRDAETIVRTLGNGLKVDRVTVVPKLVGIEDLESLEGQRFAFLAGDLSAHFDAIFGATAEHGILSISTDRACVRQGRCVMAVTTSPRVEVLVSRSASEQSSIEFAPAFRLMIMEI